MSDVEMFNGHLAVLQEEFLRPNGSWRETLFAFYTMCSMIGLEYWDKVCEIYPYTNDELNKQLVQLAKFDYTGLAIMLSIVQKVYITEKDAANSDIFRNERVDSQLGASGPLTL